MVNSSFYDFIFEKCLTMVSIRMMVCAILATVASASSNPAISVVMKRSGSGNGFNAIVEGFGFGLNMEHGSSPFKSIFCHFNRKLGGSDFDVDGDLSLSMTDKSVTGEVAVRDDSDNKLTLDVDSASSEVVKSVSYRRSGEGWSIHPMFHVKEQMTNLEASIDFDSDTNAALGVKTDGAASLIVNRRINEDTSVKIQSAAFPDLGKLKLEVSHRLDSVNLVTPTLDCGSKRLSLAWVHTLDAGRTLTAHLVPDQSMELHMKGASQENWSASMKAPWGNLNDAEFNFARKFTV